MRKIVVALALICLTAVSPPAHADGDRFGTMLRGAADRGMHPRITEMLWILRVVQDERMEAGARAEPIDPEALPRHAAIAVWEDVRKEAEPLINWPLWGKK